MSRRELQNLKDARVLRVSSSNSGNILLLYDEDHEPRVLKLYRGRRGRAKEILSGFSHYILERKRGTTPRARHRTECLTLDMWERHGFDVFQRLDQPLPPEFHPPGVWFKYYEGETLSKLIENEDVSRDRKAGWLQSLGAVFARRHTRAIDLCEPLLTHESGSLNHVFVTEDRLLSFDFEGGFRQDLPVMEALAQELAGYVRSLRRRAGTNFDVLLDAFVAGYDNVGLLTDVAKWGVYHTGYYRKVRRWYDQRRRLKNTKTDGLRILLESFPRAAPPTESD